MQRRKSAFTLIELLVVISIVALLIALLLPSLSQAREVSRNVACMSNQKQLGIGVAAYATDSRNYYPIGAMVDSATGLSHAHRWYIALGPYLNNDPLPANTYSEMTTPTLTGKSYSWDYQARGRVLSVTTDGGFGTYTVSSFGKSNVYTCPSTTGVVENTGSQPGPFPGAWDVDYQINGGVTGFNNWAGYPPATWYQPPKRDVVNPAAAWSFMDGNSWSSNGGIVSYAYPCLGVGAEYTGGVLYPATFNKGMFINRHKNGSTTNIAYFDGHGEAWWTYDRIAYISYGPDFAIRNAWWRGNSNEYNNYNYSTPF
jgi:prepilin-type N-terminal cleavage/methylation domain-containing protein/prepilin-type processing-associated H-X9-DG protein